MIIKQNYDPGDVEWLGEFNHRGFFCNTAKYQGKYKCLGKRSKNGIAVDFETTYKDSPMEAVKEMTKWIDGLVTNENN